MEYESLDIPRDATTPTQLRILNSKLQEASEKVDTMARAEAEQINLFQQQTEQLIRDAFRMGSQAGDHLAKRMGKMHADNLHAWTRKSVAVHEGMLAILGELINGSAQMRAGAPRGAPKQGRAENIMRIAKDTSEVLNPGIIADLVTSLQRLGLDLGCD